MIEAWQYSYKYERGVWNFYNLIKNHYGFFKYYKKRKLTNFKDLNLCVTGYGRKYKSYPVINKIIEGYMDQLNFTHKMTKILNMCKTYNSNRWYISSQSYEYQWKCVRIPYKTRPNGEYYFLNICTICGNARSELLDQYGDFIFEYSHHVDCFCLDDINVELPRNR